MKLKILNNSNNIIEPINNGDAGYDLIASEEPQVFGNIFQGLYYKSISHIQYETSIILEPEKKNGEYKFFNLVYPRSSIMKTNLLLANSVGVIDSGYRGSIKLCFRYIIQPEDMKIVEGKNFRGKESKGIVFSIDRNKIYRKGDRIAQLIPCLHNSMRLEYVNNLENSERGSNGFGSTGL